MKYYTETEKRLDNLLKEVWDDYEFRLAMLVYLKTEEQREQTIKFIESGNKNSDQITLFVMTITEEKDV